MTSATTPASTTSKPTTIQVPQQQPQRRTSPKPAVPAQLPQKPSYANATKPASSNQSATTGAQAPVQHGKLDKKSTADNMSAPSSAAPAGSSQSADFTRSESHGRKPSVVISASGTSGQIANGGPVGQNARPNINFGSMVNNTQSAAGPAQQASAPKSDPRVTSPEHSPAPIPQPPASGGKPPSGLHGQGNGLVFGSSGAENGDFRSSQGPLTPNAQPAHLRRESSTSGQSDLSAATGRGFMPPNGRGRGFVPGFGNQSPAQNYRPLPGARGPPNMNNQFQSPQMSNSPFRGRNSPAMMPAQPHMPQGMPYPGYPQQQHLGPQYQMYGMQPYDPSAGYYPSYTYPGHQGFPGAPPSPRNGQYPSPYVPPGPSPYHPPSMSRSGSQMSERPASSIGSRPPTTAGGASQAGTPAPGPMGTPTSSNFQIPSRTKSKAIVIKNAAGEEVHFEKKASPAPAAPAAAPPASPAPPVVVATPTPPARTPSAEPPKAEAPKAEPRSATANASIAASFQEQVRKALEAERKEKEAKEKETTAAKPAEPAAPKEEPKVEAEPAKAAEPEKAEPTGETEEEKTARLAREEEERFEREIAEMERLEEERERKEQELERAYQEKKAKEAEAKKAQEVEAAKNADEEMKRAEREAEELELKREKERAEGQTSNDADKDLFASLKRPTLGPGANAAAETSEEPADDEEETPAQGQKPKPAALKLNTSKSVEPAQPTPAMQALKSARLLDIQRDNVSYPEGISSPNPAINQAGAARGRVYDRVFLLQFQDVFKEKPTIDWDQKVKDTLGDIEPGSARAGSSRQNSTAMGGRQPSGRGAAAGGFGGQPMGSFGGQARGTSSADRFNAANAGIRSAQGGMGGFAAGRGGFAMGQPMSRTGSLQPGAPPSPRTGASRGKGSRRGPDRAMSRKEEEAANKAMPLTAAGEVKQLEKSSSGWTARSIAAPAAANAVGADGLMPPDMVQRKVKAALNKMTPEKFDKISDQIIEIANQSKSETDGRTLRQVIQLTFEKACDEAHWAGMYAKFCQKMLTNMSNDIVDETITKNGQPVIGGGLFRKYLLNRCQDEFERGWEANLPEKPEGETEEAALLSDAYYVAAAAKRRGLGLIQFIGELYKLGMLTYRIMHKCVLRLLDFQGPPDESGIENLCKLLRTVGSTMDRQDEQSHALVNAYFERINKILETNKDMPSRPRFMLMDVVDLRRTGWEDKASQKGPKTIQEIHAEAEAAAAAAEAERQKSQRGGRMPAGRGDARSFSQGIPPTDYSRNEVRMDDLRRLQNRNATNRAASSSLGPSLGPGSSLYAGRTGSGRRGLGPPRDGESSGPASRTGTPPIKSEAPSAATNAFSALAALENEGANDAGESARSPPASPEVANATPSIDATAASADEANAEA